jgi:hypothetical protein
MGARPRKRAAHQKHVLFLLCSKCEEQQLHQRDNIQDSIHRIASLRERAVRDSGLGPAPAGLGVRHTVMLSAQSKCWSGREKRDNDAI